MIARFTAYLVNVFLGLVEAFLALRIILRFFAANPGNGFVDWIYTSSSVLLEPFRGIFSTEVIGRNHVLDFTALFAMLVYAVFAALVVAILLMLDPARYSFKKH